MNGTEIDDVDPSQAIIRVIREEMVTLRLGIVAMARLLGVHYSSLSHLLSVSESRPLTPIVALGLLLARPDSAPLIRRWRCIGSRPEDNRRRGKLTDALRLAIVTRKRAGEAATVLAREYGVSRQAIYRAEWAARSQEFGVCSFVRPGPKILSRDQEGRHNLYQTFSWETKHDGLRQEYLYTDGTRQEYFDEDRSGETLRYDTGSLEENEKRKILP